MNNTEIGFYYPFMKGNDQDKLIHNVLNDISKNANTILFNSKYEMITPDKQEYAILHCSQSKYFYGILFGFDIDSISIINTFPGPSKKVFLASDIFWQEKNIPTKVWDSLLTENINIVTYNETIYDLYSICFKEPLYNMKNGLNPEELNYVIQNLLITQ
jgi:hypothetical protein